MASPFLQKPATKSLPPLKARIYPQDPFVAREIPYLDPVEGASRNTVQLAGEACLGAGPTSSRVAVVDYNADLDELFEPAKVKADGKGFVVGRRHPVDNFHFHQVNVWAVITRTLDLLEGERMFGRRIPWAFNQGRLLVLPHAGYWENAFYERESGALHFFYFVDPTDGDTVFTCLSHDIVTHELGHAVLDGLKPHYNEVSSAATAGFHEYFGDAVALTMALTLRPNVVYLAGIGEGDLSAPNTVSNIANQFGKAISTERYGSLADAYLRSGLNDQTMDDLVGVTEEHAYSEVLTGAYYDLLQEIYAQERRWLLATKEGPEPSLNGGERVRLLMRSATATAQLMLRAMDYCPPVDVDFADYARAVLRAHEIADPLDSKGHRELAREVFVRRKILTAEDELAVRRRIQNYQLRDLDVETIGASITDAYRFVDGNRLILDIPPEVNFEVARVYRTAKVSANGYRPPQEVIVEFVWPERLELRGPRFGELAGSRAELWCGGTLVFNRDGNLLHYVVKNATPERRAAFRDYVAHLVGKRRISLDDGERGLGARAGGGNAVAATIDGGGRLRMRRTAAFRHLY